MATKEIISLDPLLKEFQLLVIKLQVYSFEIRSEYFSMTDKDKNKEYGKKMIEKSYKVENVIINITNELTKLNGIIKNERTPAP